MIQRQSPDLFCHSITLLLLLTHFLNFLIKFYQPVDVPALAQYIAIFCAQLLTIFTWFYYEGKRREKITPLRPHWHWISLKHYINITKVRSLPDFCISLLLHAFSICVVFRVCIGVLGISRTCLITSVIIMILDTAVSIPLFLSVVIRKDISPVSVVLMLQYVFGDCVTLFLLLGRNAGWSLWLKSILQGTVDSITAVSYFIQRRNAQPTEPIETLPLLWLL
jgi:hypothetical protein